MTGQTRWRKSWSVFNRLENAHDADKKIVSSGNSNQSGVTLTVNGSSPSPIPKSCLTGCLNASRATNFSAEWHCAHAQDNSLKVNKKCESCKN
ncbi:hypothetical protein AVEN_79121-1 [Araneus ventricosus]|uniref:Uncharacterized protein n=1 Tax=Araneus ventricosus TaxID=182803 RepID=A0A4Y2PTY7_ARAVE|nr:hypothetical protein AVEN_79121-1 [Araneus ventricosus]